MNKQIVCKRWKQRENEGERQIKEKRNNEIKKEKQKKEKMVFIHMQYP